MTTPTELFSMQVLQEANTIVNYLTRIVDDIETFHGGIIRRFEVLDSVVGSDEIHATVEFKLSGCPIPMSMHLPWISPETLTMLLFAADTDNCQDRRDARNEFAQTYLGAYITILFIEAQRVKQLAQTQMN